jgi:GTP-binding protein
MNAVFVTSALTPAQLPGMSLPEIAVVGRSNSGKSTLINALVNQKNLVRSGRTPGQTQLINFFRVDERWMVVDLPGYGFSASGKGVADHWQTLAEAYFARPTVRTVLMLTDARRGMEERDIDLMSHLAVGARVIILATKTDKLNMKEREQCRKQLTAQLAATPFKDIPVMMISAQKGDGMAQLKKIVFSTSAK